MYRRLLLFFIILFFNVNAVYALTVKNIISNKTVIQQFEKFELTLGISDFYSLPDEIQIEVKFTLLDKTHPKDIIVSGFPCHGNYKVRFTLGEMGRYSYDITVKSGSDIVKLGPYKFTCIAPTKAKYGFLRKWTTDQHRLVFDSGQHFYILGENRFNIYDPSWNYADKSIEEYIAYMAENGMNTLRVFIRCARNVNDEIQFGYLEPKIGFFDEEVADRLDTVIESCQNNDIYLILVVFALGFTPNDSFKNWYNNPYSEVNGGYCNIKEEFFTNEEAISYQKKKIKYIIDRWGYTTHLLAIDLFNEPEWDGSFPERLWVPWAIQQAEYIKKIDPYGHLITLGSVGPQWNIRGDNEQKWYDSNINDTIQWHLYGVDSPIEVSYKMRNFIRKYWTENKPIYCGEFAWGEEPKPAYDHTHNGIWAAIMSGGGVLAHSAPEYNPDTDEVMVPARAGHFKALAEFLKDVPWDKNLQYKAAGIVSNSPGVKVWALSSNDYVLVWLLDGDKKKYGQRLNSLTLTVAGLAEGEYLVEWWDTRQGVPLSSEAVNCRNNILKVNIPSFEKDIACKIKSFVK